MNKTPVVPKQYLIPFILVTVLFALWGFANNFTDPLVKVFKDVFAITNAQSTWVQMAFYGGYATMAIPAALFIRKFSYKAGILMGLGLFATGTMLSIPAANSVNFNLFIAAIYILTFGLAFLETTANPYILSMGSDETSTQRLNLAQAFNPIGSLGGAFVAASFVLSNIQVADFKQDISGYKEELAVEKSATNELNILPFLKAKEKPRKNDENAKQYVVEQTSEKTDVDTAIKDFRDGKIESYQGKTFPEIQKHDLNLVSKTYMTLGLVVLAVFVIFVIKKMPSAAKTDDNDHELHVKSTLARLFKNPRYIWGVVAQMFYVGAQIMVWTFIFHYAETEVGMDNATAGNHQLAALVLFLSFRFICTAFLKYISPGKILFVLAAAGIACTLGAIYLTGMSGLYSLMLVSACMSLMFPTIYGMALEGVGQDAKLGSAGLILAIVGAVWLTGFQGRILDLESFMGTTSVRGSFYLTVACFLIIAIYGFFFRNPRSKQA
ncbi:MFS transporter [Rubritalea sp.]|uniref:MFS transporter n=1 Tax=Rubritalea sp. TaxID=2109375 RepID=UPI003EF756E1